MIQTNNKGYQLNKHNERYGGESPPFERLKETNSKFYKSPQTPVPIEISQNESLLRLSQRSPIDASPIGSTSQIKNIQNNKPKNSPHCRVKSSPNPSISVCLQHPNRKANYYVSSDIQQRYCSKCALFQALKGQRVEVAFEEEEQFRKQETDNLIDKMKMTTEMLAICEEQSTNGESQIIDFYERQLATVKDALIGAQRILLEEQSKIIEKISSARNESLKQAKQWKDQVNIFKGQVEQQQKDVSTYYDSIITQMNTSPFIEIITKYNQDLADIQLQMKNLSLQRIPVLTVSELDLNNLKISIEQNLVRLSNEHMQIIEKQVQDIYSGIFNNKQPQKINTKVSSMSSSSPEPSRFKESNGFSQLSTTNTNSTIPCLDFSSFRRNHSLNQNSETFKMLSLTDREGKESSIQKGLIQPQQTVYIKTEPAHQQSDEIDAVLRQKSLTNNSFIAQSSSQQRLEAEQNNIFNSNALSKKIPDMAQASRIIQFKQVPSYQSQQQNQQSQLDSPAYKLNVQKQQSQQSLSTRTSLGQLYQPPQRESMKNSQIISKKRERTELAGKSSFASYSQNKGEDVQSANIGGNASSMGQKILSQNYLKGSIDFRLFSSLGFNNNIQNHNSK